MSNLNPDVLFEAKGRVIGGEGELHDAVESTMDAARRAAQRDAPDGYCVLAERQRAGRGRTGGWDCPAGEGVLLSVLLRLGVRASERWMLGLLAAVAAAEAAAEFAPDVQIKWPNDVVVAPPADEPFRPRKLGGVIVEQVPQADAAPAHIVGIGLNVNQDSRRLPTGTPLPATSLKIERGGRDVDRNTLCAKLFDRLDHWYAQLRAGRPETILARWRTLSCVLGRDVRALVDGRTMTVHVIGLRATGELIVRTDAEPELLLTAERARLVFDQ